MPNNDSDKKIGELYPHTHQVIARFFHSPLLSLSWVIFSFPFSSFILDLRLISADHFQPTNYMLRRSVMSKLIVSSLNTLSLSVLYFIHIFLRWMLDDGALLYSFTALSNSRDFILYFIVVCLVARIKSSHYDMY